MGHKYMYKSVVGGLKLKHQTPQVPGGVLLGVGLAPEGALTGARGFLGFLGPGDPQVHGGG